MAFQISMPRGLEVKDCKNLDKLIDFVRNKQ